MNSRPVSVSHLVFGLIFLGGAAMWAVGAATDADAPDMAVIAPTVLIAAGVAGLIAIVFNARNARISADAVRREAEVEAEADATGPAPAAPEAEPEADATATTDTVQHADTGVTHDEETS